MNLEKMEWYDKKRIWCGFPWTFTRYGFDKERFFVETGLFTTKNYDTRLYRITNTSVSRNFIQKIFGLGTIHVDGTDKDLGNFDIVNIKDSLNVKELLDQAIEDERQRNKVSVREFVSEFDDED